MVDMKRQARKHILKLISVGMILFGGLVAIPIGMVNVNDPLGWFLTAGILMVAAGIFILLLYIDRAILKHRQRFYGTSWFWR